MYKNLNRGIKKNYIGILEIRKYYKWNKKVIYYIG